MKEPTSPLPFKQNTWDIIVYNEEKHEFESIFDPQDKMLDNLKDCAYIVEASNNYPKAVELLRQALNDKPDNTKIEEFLKQIDALEGDNEQPYTSTFDINLRNSESAERFKRVFPRFCKSLNVECEIKTKKRLFPWLKVNAKINIYGAKLDVRKASSAIEWIS